MTNPLASQQPAPIPITRDRAILGFLQFKYPDQVAEAEKLVDSLIELGVTGISVATPLRTPGGDKP